MRSPGAGTSGLSDTSVAANARPIGSGEHDLVHDAVHLLGPLEVVRVLLPEAGVGVPPHVRTLVLVHLGVRILAAVAARTAPRSRPRAASSSAGGSPGSGIVRSTADRRPTPRVRRAAGGAVGEARPVAALVLDGQAGEPVDLDDVVDELVGRLARRRRRPPAPRRRRSPRRRRPLRWGRWPRRASNPRATTTHIGRPSAPPAIPKDAPPGAVSIRPTSMSSPSAMPTRTSPSTCARPVRWPSTVERTTSRIPSSVVRSDTSSICGRGSRSRRRRARPRRSPATAPPLVVGRRPRQRGDGVEVGLGGARQRPAGDGTGDQRDRQRRAERTGAPPLALASMRWWTSATSARRAHPAGPLAAGGP